VEEASHIASEDSYVKLLGSCRSTIPELPPRMMLTSNPDGDGKAWLKKRFRIKPGGKIQAFITEQGRKMMYIPSTVNDNPSLLKDDNYIRFLDSIVDPDLRKAWKDGDWDAFGVKGSYYGDLVETMKRDKRVRHVPYERELPVYTYWDLGMSDMMVILFVQYVGREIHIIDMYEMNGQDLAHYVAKMYAKGFVYGGSYLPHDVRVRELGTGKSRLEVLEGMVTHPVYVAPSLSLQDGINQVRLKFPRIWIDEVKCARLVEALELYRKEWIEELLTFRDKPVHDWTSHVVDPLRYLAISEEPMNTIMATNNQTTYNDLNSAI